MKAPQSLFYICPIKNLPSILEKGIYSRHEIRIRGIKHEDIHDASVLDKRNKNIPITHRNLQEYVNLYFCARNAMLYRLTRNYEAKDIVVLSINPNVLDEEGTIISDRNAATDAASFSRLPDGLKEIDERVFKKSYWADSDDTKQKMMAEVLVLKHIKPSKIVAIYVSPSEATNDIESIIQNDFKEIIKEPNIFFQPEWRKRISSNISLSKGDMFFSPMQTFAISVNVVGVMGRGLASRTKYQFPDAYVRYQDDCKSKKLKIGKPTLFKRAIRIERELADDSSQLKEGKINGSRWFLFFPTKRHWRENSKLEDIEASLQWLINNYQEQKIESLALPALGCGLGNLTWKEVGPMMCRYLDTMDIQSCIYLPTEKETPPEYLNAQYLLEDNHGTP